jgi:hypothetical protein
MLFISCPTVHDPSASSQPNYGRRRQSMIPKSGRRFSEKIMLKQQAKAKCANQSKIISL